MEICIRQQTRVALHRLEVGAAHAAIKKAERIARKENRAVPKEEMGQLADVLRGAKLNERSAVAALEAVLKFPPLSV